VRVVKTEESGKKVKL